MICGAYIGSILPDIDYLGFFKRKNSKIKISNKITKNNIALHAPLIYLLIYSILYEVVSDDIWRIIFNGSFLGIFIHLLLEGIFIQGIPWFYPISKKTSSLGHIKFKEELLISKILMLISIVILLDMIDIVSIFKFTQGHLG